MSLLQEYSWPGNVRELENLIKRLSVLYAEQTITRETIEKELFSNRQEADNSQINNNESLSESIERHLTSYFATRKHTANTWPVQPNIKRVRETVISYHIGRNPRKSIKSGGPFGVKS